MADSQRLTRALVDTTLSEVWDLSLDLHRHPELSGEETRSAGRLTAYLASKGFEIENNLGGLSTAFRAERRHGKDGPRIAFLAEYDALPGIGHACGHNWIAASGVGAAVIAAQSASQECPGSIVLFGTPAEETFGGKAVLVEAGCFDDIDAALMVHPACETRVNTTSLASHEFVITFLGKEAHAAASPELGVNALDALVQFYQSLDLLKKQLRRDVVIPGIILEGGRRPNIVPAKAVGGFSVRAADSEYLAEVLAKVEKAAHAAAQTHGASLEIVFEDNPYKEMRTNSIMAERFAQVLDNEKVPYLKTPRERMGSLDMGNISHQLPSIHPMIAICQDISAHTPEFAEASVSDEAQRMLKITLRALAETGLEFLENAQFREDVKESFEAPF